MNTQAETRCVPHIRWMIRRDMHEVLAIEARSDAYPWREDEFVSALRGRNCIGMVAERGEKIIGSMVYELHKTRLHILKFAVHPAWRRRGIGAEMVATLVRKLSVAKRQFIVVDTRESDLPRQLFFRSQGFKAVQVQRDYYEDTGESCYVMQYVLPGWGPT